MRVPIIVHAKRFNLANVMSAMDQTDFAFKIMMLLASIVS